MRAIVSVLGLLLVVAIVGLLAKKQLSTPIAGPEATPGATVQQQSQQVQQQVKQSVEAAMQQARPVPDDK
jgi:Na+-transporting methylmalonyl-CoA/oxaloacetate decarboxylase gamma subunit